MKMIFGISIFFLIFGCQLNSKQEEALNASLKQYLIARNDKKILSYVSFQMPCLIKHYKSKGDEIFTKQYDLKSNPKYKEYWDNYILREISTQSQNIQVHYLLDATSVDTELESVRKVNLYAVSNDSGKTWYFADEDEYFDKNVCSTWKRFFSQAKK